MTSTLLSPPSCHTTLTPLNMSCGLSTNNSLDDRPTTVSTRPKLTLQTSSLPRTTGSSSTGLSFSFASGPSASPTVLNTFKNAYDVAFPASATSSPSRAPNKQHKPASPYVANNYSGPYQLPLGVKSILRNSPLNQLSRRRSVSVSGGPNTRRVFFPAKKQVSYRHPLQEEIQTVKYTARHSDLGREPEPEPGVAGSDTDSDSTTQSDTGGSDDDVGSAGDGASLSKFERKKRKQLSAQRQIRAVALLDGLEEETYGPVTTPQTPQDRVKRRCEWKWTLGPIENRNETFGFPPTPTKATFSSPSVPPSDLGDEGRSREKETRIPCVSDEPCSFEEPSDPSPPLALHDPHDDIEKTIQ